MSAALSSRISGGGITKRSGGGRARIDRDGDLDMDAPAQGRGRGGRRRGGGHGHININAPKGPAADREKKGGSGARRGSQRDPVGTRSRTGNGRKGNNAQQQQQQQPLVGVKVHGWKQSKGSAEECVRFLERKTNLKFKKTQKQGEYLMIYVQPADLQSVLDWDKAKFAGVNIKITADMVADLFNTTMEDVTPKNSSTVETIKVLEEVLRLRYNPETKLLDLSKLRDDPLLRQNGFFELNSTRSKMFPALMAVADKKFENAQQKKDAIHSVTLAYNNLKTVSPVTTLSITFPDIRNLSLEGNFIEDLKAIDGWRNRFRALEMLLLIGNPITALPNYRDEMARRYPKLTVLDNVPVERSAIQIGDPTSGGAIQRPSAAIGPNGQPILPLPVKENLLVDENGAIMRFLADFFTQIDTNKDGVIDKFYTPQSKFSLSVNTSAPRVEALHGERQYWDAYIPKSRNMKRIHDGPEAFNRLSTGMDEIRALWKTLPATRHNLANTELWSFDIFPDEVRPGIMGHLAVVHSEFDEMNLGSGGVMKRSFDRSFMLWIDPTNGDVKVVSDVLTVRSYAGASAWKVEPPTAVATEQTPENAATGSGTDEKKQKIQMLIEKTNLTVPFAEMCLNDTNWDLARAWDAFVWAKDNHQLGVNAFTVAPPEVIAYAEAQAAAQAAQAGQL